MKKIFTKPLALTALLCVVVVSTFAISFAYWKSGIDGNFENKTLNINIGEGNAMETKVNLGAVNLDGKALIPNSRIPGEGQTNKITFTVKVTWIPENDNLPTAEKDNFEAHTGELTVSCTQIMLGAQNPEDVIDWKGLGGYPLFNVSSSRAYYDIVGNDPNGVDVEITVVMSEPVDKEQYLAVAGNGITITLKFLVKSQYELGNA